VSKKQNDIFCLFKIAIQGFSLWHFHVYLTFLLLQWFKKHLNHF
jgi:hypothetical protein